MPARSGILFVVSGPSGSGKTTLCRRLAEEGEARYSVSCTTRPPRPGEQNGVDYHFLSPDAFSLRIDAGDFLEHAQVHGNRYGTLKTEVLQPISQGTDVVMDIDVQGAALVRSCDDPAIRAAIVDLFVMPPGDQELRKRLTGRGTDSEDVIAVRMRNALEETGRWREYTYLLVSSTRDDDYLRFKALLCAERLRVARLLP